MTHLSYTTRDAGVLMQLSGLLEGIKNKKKFSCQSQTLRLNFSLSAADEEKNKGKQALRYS